MFDNLDDPKTQLLLQMGLGLLGGAPNSRKNFGADIAHAGLLGLQGYSHAQHAKSRRDVEKQRSEMHQLQMDQFKRAQADQDGLRDVFARNITPGSPQMQPGDYETPSGPAGPSSFNMEGLKASLMQLGPAGMPHLAQLSSMSRADAPIALPKGARLVGKDGRVIADAVPDAPKTPEIGALKEVKSGNKIFTYEFTKDRKWEKVAEAPLWKPDGPDKPDKPPQGYRWAGDKLEPIPGGPADAKVGEKAEALRKRENNAVEQAKFMVGKIGEAIKGVGPTTVGPLGAITRNIPGTKGYDLKSTVDTVKANIGFAELQAMREASPTGGALGQVAVQELNALQATRGNLDTAQSQDQILKNLYAMEKHFNNWLHAVQQAGKQGGQQGNPPVRRFNPETGKIE